MLSCLSGVADFYALCICKGRCKCLFLFFAMFASECNATSISVNVRSPYPVEPYFRVNATAIWLPEPPSVRNPCLGSQKICRFAFAWLTDDGRLLENGTNVTQHWQGFYPEVFNKITTLEGMRVLYLKKFPNPSSVAGVSPSYWDLEKGCLLLAYNRGDNTGWHRFQGSSCTYNDVIKPEPNVCTISGSFNIAYGNIEISSFEGLQKTSTASLMCSQDGQVTITAKPLNGSFVPLRSDFSLRATLQVNDKAGSVGDKISVKAKTPVNITVRSTLTAPGSVTPGTFTGSGAVVVDVN